MNILVSLQTRINRCRAFWILINYVITLLSNTLSRVICEMNYNWSKMVLDIRIHYLDICRCSIKRERVQLYTNGWYGFDNIYT